MAAKISERSTKQDIWEAYTKLLSESTAQTPVQLDDAPTKSNLGAMSSAADELTKALSSTMAEVEKELEKQNNNSLLAQKHHADQMAKIAEQKSQLESELKQVSEAAGLQEQTKKQERLRAEEEYNYQLDKKRRVEQDSYDKLHQAKEADLLLRQQDVSSKESRLSVLEDLASGFEPKLEAAIKSAKEEAIKDLLVKHQTELRELNTSQKHEKELLGLQVKSLEQNIIRHVKELDDTKTQLNSAQQQLKDMAVTVIRAQSPANDKNARTES